MPDRRGNIKCKDPVKLAAMAAAKAAAPSAAAMQRDEEGEIDDFFWAKEDATDERKQADAWSNVKPCSWASQRALPRVGYRRVGDVYWPAPSDAFAATLTDAEKREKKEKKRAKKEKKERKEKKTRESEDSEDSEEQAKKKKKKEKKEKTDDPWTSLGSWNRN